MAYTLIATMVLMILSTSLFTAAGSNLTLSTKNTEARQSYITCKSAVEYAKSVILQKAETAKEANKNREEGNLCADSTNALSVANTIKDTMTGFDVKQNSDPTSVSGFKIAPLDDTTTLAKCHTTLTAVTQTLVQAVTTCKMNPTNNSYTVTVESQTITNTLDPTKGLSDSGNITKQEVKVNETQTKNTTVSVADKTEILFIRYVFTYHVAITAAEQYSASDDRVQTLSYETDCTIGGSDKNVTLAPSAVEVPVGTQNPGTKMIAVDGTYGGVKFTNGDYLRPYFGNSGWDFWYYWLSPWSYHWMHPWLYPSGISNLPLLFKDTIRSSGNSGYLNAPAVYFMNSTSFSVEDTLPTFAGNQYCAAIDSDFIYFNGEIDGLQYVGDSYHIYRSMLKLVNSRNSLKLSNGYDGIVQFNKTTIQMQSKDNYGGITIVKKDLDGLYYFKNFTDLFDFSGLDTNLKAVPQTDYPAISSVANQDYVNYLKLNIDQESGVANILSGDSWSGDGVRWVQGGDISNGTPSNQKDKTVYCYADDCSTWVNTLSNYPNTAYGAKNIVFEWAGDYPLTVPAGRTATFQADYINMNTNSEPIQSWVGYNSKFVIKSVNGTDPLTMVFTQDTPIQYYDYYYDYPLYTIKAGTYSGVPSGLNLFSKEASDFFADPSHMTASSAFQKTNQLQTAVPNFLLYGAKYGGQPWVYNNVNTPGFVQNINGYGHSAYPVLLNQSMQISSGYQDRILIAPQVYFMDTGDSIYGYSNGNAKICSDFIYIAGNIKGQNNSLVLTTCSGDSGIVYLKNCHISNSDTGYSADLSGYYSFKSGADLFALKGDIKGNGNGNTNELKKIKDQSEINKIISDNCVDYMEQQYGNVISGDTTSGGNAPANSAANWAPNGVLSETTSDTFNGKDAYLYVNDASKWGTLAANYQASRINLQYVYAGALTVPESKEVTFTADTLSLNGQKTDVSQTDDKLVLQQGGASSKFIVRTLSGTGSVTITLPHTLVVTDSAGNLIYSVNAGVYTVKSGTDLFVHPFSSGTATITLGQITISPGASEQIFKKGKYTNE